MFVEEVQKTYTYLNEGYCEERLCHGLLATEERIFVLCLRASWGSTNDVH